MLSVLRYTILDHTKGDEPVVLAHCATSHVVHLLLNGWWMEGKELGDLTVVNEHEGTRFDGWTWGTRRGDTMK